MSQQPLDTTIHDLIGHEDDRSGSIIVEIKEHEDLIKSKEEELYVLRARLETLKKTNAENTIIKWKKAVMHCLEVDQNKSRWFLKSTHSVSRCVSKKYTVDIDRKSRNKISTTLSTMFKNKEIGRVHYNNITYYGLLTFFENDLITVKTEYEQYLKDLTEIA